jgi:flagellar hook-associated protein 2
MSTNGSIFSVGGLASGLDTNTIVDQLMSIERQPQVRIAQQKTIETARQQALRDINTRLVNLDSAIAGLRDVGTWGDVQSIDSSDATRVSAVRTGGAAAGGYSIGVTRLARAQQMLQGTAASAASADSTLTIQVGSGTAVDVSLTAGDSLQTVADKINGSSGMGVYASVVNSKLVLSGRTTGAANTISVTGSAAADFGFAQSQAALDAEYTVDGVAKTSSSNTVTDALAGVTLTLKATTASDVSVSIGAPGPDTSAVQAKVQAFIDQYNSTIEFIRGKLNEKVVPNPQTDADRVKGVLQNDSALSGLLANLRSAIADPVSGRPTASSLLSQIGVSTGASTGDAGKLKLDSAKLTDALTNRFADTKALLNNATGDYSTMGLSQRLDSIVNAWTDSSTGIISSRISSEQSTIDALTQRSADMDVRLATREQALKAQFTAMETALSQAQSQSAWLTSQIAQLG